MQMKNRKLNYTLRGEPYSLIRYENSRPPPGEVPAKSDQIRFLIEIERQHEGLEIIKGPVHLDATFYFSFKKNYYRDRAHAYGINSISRFIHGLEMLLVGNVIVSSVYISSCKAARFYAKIPRIKFSITELDGIKPSTSCRQLSNV